MFKNYLRTATKNILNNKFFAMINVLGLAIGLCVFILVAFYVEKEFSYDTQWADAERVYRINSIIAPGSVNPNKGPLIPYPAGPALQQNFPDEVEVVARSTFPAGNIVVNGQSFPEPVRVFEPAILDIFSFDVLAGSLEATFADPSRIALTEESAIEYFGHDAPLGEILSVQQPDGSSTDFEVTAIYRIPEGESMLGGYFPNMALLEEASLTDMTPFLQTWSPPFLSVGFVKLASGSDVTGLNSQLNILADRNQDSQPGPPGQPGPSGLEIDLELQPITAAHFNPNNNEQGGDRAQVLSFLLIGALVLGLGMINYIILTTANVIARRRESGIRKVAGAQWGELVRQYTGESVILTAVALMVALTLVDVALPFFNSLTGTELVVSYMELPDVLFLIVLVGIVGGLGGLYPAVLISRARPQDVLRQGRHTGIRNSSGKRNALLGFQFAVAITLMAAALVMYSQLSFYKNRNHNFNAENLLQLEIPGPPIPPRYPQKNTLVEELKKSPGVVNVTLASREVNDSPSSAITTVDFEVPGSGIGAISSRMMAVGYDFFSVYEIPLLAGRTFAMPQDAPEGSQQSRVIINLFAARALGFASPEDAIGKVISSDARGLADATVIGVVEDNQFISYRSATAPEVYTLNPVRSRFLTARFRNEVADSIVGSVETVWREVYGDEEMNSKFAIENLRAEFAREENDGKLLLTLSFLSIFIACLGLYGLVTFTVKGKVKEIGIRKVMGASVGAIVSLFIAQFTRPVILANVIAWPAAAWAMLNWLQRFPYQVDTWFLIPLFLMAGVVALLVAWLTVGGTAAKAASRKPVLALRYE